MLFGPLQGVLKKREALTEGTRKAADQSLQDAERKVQEYEARIREARGEVYREQEEMRRQWLADQSAQVAQAREASSAKLAKARAELATEMAAARQSLTESSNLLADEIATAVLSRSAG
jgi:F-type H+-transporting ATPase subunit b